LEIARLIADFFTPIAIGALGIWANISLRKRERQMESERLDFEAERDLGISGIKDKELHKSIGLRGIRQRL